MFYSAHGLCFKRLNYLILWMKAFSACVTIQMKALSGAVLSDSAVYFKPITIGILVAVEKCN